MRLVLLAVAAGLGAWLLRRGRRRGAERVVVAWEDGSELELGSQARGRERLVAIAARVLR